MKELVMHRIGMVRACELPVIALALMSLDYEAAISARMVESGDDRQAAIEHVWDHCLTALEVKRYEARAASVQATVRLLTTEA